MIPSEIAELSRPRKPGILHVLHGRGGGTEKYVQELIFASRDDYRHYLLRILDGRWQLSDNDGPAPTRYEIGRGGENANGDELGPLCARLGIGLMHIHSLVGSDDDLLQILEAIPIPYCYSIHDMYLACPTVYLIDSKGAYCEATTDSSICGRCLAKFDAWENVDIVAWRSRYRMFLEGASMVFAPSRWARDTIAKYYPGVEITVSPPRPDFRDEKEAQRISNGFDLPADGHRHIGVLGAIGPEKGARQVELLARRIRERQLPLRIVVIGYTDRDNRHQSQDLVFTVHGRYDGDEIDALFAHYRIAMLVFPTFWPETFSYTLSEGWRAGRPALVPPRGALQERVLATGAGWIMEGWPDADSILDQLMNLTAPGNAQDLERAARLAKAAGDERLDPAGLMRKSYAEMLAAPARNC